MGRIVTTVDVENTAGLRFSMKLDALVDTGASLSMRKYEPLLGYIALKQYGAAVNLDLSGPHGHRRTSCDAAECAR